MAISRVWQLLSIKCTLIRWTCCSSCCCRCRCGRCCGRRRSSCCGGCCSCCCSGGGCCGGGCCGWVSRRVRGWVCWCVSGFRSGWSIVTNTRRGRILLYATFGIGVKYQIVRYTFVNARFGGEICCAMNLTSVVSMTIT